MDHGKSRSVYLTRVRSLWSPLAGKPLIVQWTGQSAIALPMEAKPTITSPEGRAIWEAPRYPLISLANIHKLARSRFCPALLGFQGMKVIKRRIAVLVFAGSIYQSAARAVVPRHRENARRFRPSSDIQRRFHAGLRFLFQCAAATIPVVQRHELVFLFLVSSHCSHNEARSVSQCPGSVLHWPVFR
jgi:hypothetical protein